jgi:PHP family Zn ribbon phosphoesterase
MTPPNIVNMAVLKGLELIAVTDHNSARNARAVIRAARGLPLKVLAGLEATCAEEIHMVCLFPDADKAEAAGAFFEKHLPPVVNRPEYFGEQLEMDENERISSRFPYLLPNALDISIDRLPELVCAFGGFCYPAHIDRQSNSILPVFGGMPDRPVFQTVEVFDPERFFKAKENLHFQHAYRVVTSSDAHRLADISERAHFIELERPDFESLRQVLCPEML